MEFNPFNSQRRIIVPPIHTYIIYTRASELRFFYSSKIEYQKHAAIHEIQYRTRAHAVYIHCSIELSHPLHFTEQKEVWVRAERLRGCIELPPRKRDFILFSTREGITMNSNILIPARAFIYTKLDSSDRSRASSLGIIDLELPILGARI